MKTLAYQINEIPDPFYPEYQMVSVGDVIAGVRDDFEHLLRTVASLPAGSVSVSIRFDYSPNAKNGDPQSRLRIYLLALIRTQAIAESLRVLFEHGPLGRFYNLKKINHNNESWEKFKALCEIIRREEAIEPLYSSEYNDKIPPFYYTIQSFNPNDKNDYMDLDRVLGGIREEAIINVSVEPVDISAELSAHTRYLSLLQSINRTWDRTDDEPILQNYFKDTADWYIDRSQSIKPMRHPDPLAEDILRSQQRFHETLRQPHLQFAISVLAQTKAVAQLIGSVVAESAFEGGSYHLLSSDQKEKGFKEQMQSIQELRNLPISAHKSLFQKKDPLYYSGLSRMSHIATVEELSGIVRLPVAPINSPCCIRKNTDPPNENGDRLITFGFDQNTFSKEGKGLDRGYAIIQSCKHAFFSGSTGTSKTNSTLNLIFEHFPHGIPFLVIEPVKTEYRILKTLKKHSDKTARQLAEAVEIYTPGNENISPYRFNPLWRCQGIAVEEHIDYILSCFMAAMPVSGPLPALLGEALERVYEDHPKEDDPPIMDDLVTATERVLNEKGYSAETNSDIRAALEVRLGTLTRRHIGKVFQSQFSVPNIKHLMAVPTIIEFDRLHLDQSCLLTLFILTSIREYLKTSPKTTEGLRYLIIIEEAHIIAGSTNKAVASADIADPRAFSTEMICRMLAELRALGVGIVIVDQFPSAVAPEVIKSTTTKLAFRQVAKEDREELGAAMLFGQAEMEEIARLKVGEAFFITEGYYKPRRIQTVNLHNRFDFNTPTLNEKILAYMQDDTWFKDAALQRTAAELTQLRKKMDGYDNKRIKMMGELAVLLAQYPKILAQPNTKEKFQMLNKIMCEAQELKHRLSISYRSFFKDTYKKYLNSNIPSIVKDPVVIELWENIVNRFKSIIRPDVKSTSNLIDEFIARCQRDISLGD
jgi:hypothetical protein